MVAVIGRVEWGQCTGNAEDMFVLYERGETR